MARKTDKSAKTPHSIQGVVAAFIDIDSIREAERYRAALRQERRLATVLRGANDAVTVQDFEGHILAWNRRAEEMYGYSEAEALKLDANALAPLNNHSKTRDLIGRIQRCEDVPAFETHRLTKDGTRIKVSLTATALLDEAGKPASIDITERNIED